jgi:hypothetical protein
MLEFYFYSDSLVFITKNRSQMVDLYDILDHIKTIVMGPLKIRTINSIGN